MGLLGVSSLLRAQDASTGDPTVMAIGTSKQLFVDDHVIAARTGVEREPGVPERVGVVLEPMLPTEVSPVSGLPETFGFYTSVAYDESRGRFQMWYHAGRHAGVGYAESDDGLVWTRPMRGGELPANIVVACLGFSCAIDPTVPWGHKEKYKAAGCPLHSTGRRHAAHLLHSPDGKQWRYYNGGNQVTGRAGDTCNQVVWDPIGERYRLSTRTDLAREELGELEYRSVRIMAHCDNDLRSHPTAWKTVADRIVVADPRNETILQSTTPRRQFHHITTWIHEGIYFGLMSVWEIAAQRWGDLEGGDFVTRHEDNTADFYLGASRDGRDFDRTWLNARRPFLPRGPEGEWDKDTIMPPAQIVTRGDRHWIYYHGANERIYARKRLARIGLAHLRLDGFVRLRAGETAGIVETRTFRLEGRSLELNLECRTGRLLVAVLDGFGSEIPGFGLRDCVPVEDADAVRFVPRWCNRADLAPLKGTRVRLQFVLRRCSLYAFQIRP